MQQTYAWKTIGLVVLAMTLIVSGDAAGKILTAAGFTPFFVAWARFAMAVVLVLPLASLKRAELPDLFNWRLILRGLLIACGVMSILTALKTEPIANVFGGFFVGPIVAYFLSALVLKERITWMRTGLLLVGFIGVLIVVRPGFGMTVGLGYAVLAGCFHGTYLVATRWLAGGFRPRLMLLSQLVAGAIFMTPFALGPAPAITVAYGWLLVASACGSAAGNLILVTVSRTTPAGVIAPLIYSQLLVAMVLGLVVFGEFPDALSLLGLLIIAVAGVSSVWFAGRGR